MSCLFLEERGRRGSIIQAQPDLSQIFLCAAVVVVVVRSVVDILFSLEMLLSMLYVLCVLCGREDEEAALF